MKTINTNTKKFALDNHVLQLDIDREGKITRRTQSLVRGEGRLENTLLSALYPDIRVATVNVPKQMDMHEEVRVHETMANLQHKGIHYILVGASGSAKEGKFYFVDEKYSKIIARRFHNWPEAAMVYFGMLVSPCEAMIEEDDARILVVPDHALGTNDCRGWIKRSLFEKLGLPGNHLYQFRIAFENAQGKGCFKVMEDNVSEALGADVILPESSLKPGLKMEDGDTQALRVVKRIVPAARSIFTPWAQHELKKPRAQESFSIFSSDRRFQGRVVVGVREISRELEFTSSYQLTQFASHNSIQLEILPETLEVIRRLTEAVREGQYEELMELLGGVPTGFLPTGLEQETHDDPEYDIVRALLTADASGVMVGYPYVKNRLNELLARWAFKVSTGGGYRLPAFMLADDGYLALLNGTVYCGSDWIPQEKAIMRGDSTRGLVVRYPIRMFEDLLPLENLSSGELHRLLAERLRKQGLTLPQTALDELIERQLNLEGTLVLHSQTATRNGGDFDGDWCGLMYQERFPQFVESRFNLKDEFKQTKTKLAKKRSNPLNTEAVALAAVGNWIGSITDLITSCIAAGREDRAYQLVGELQNALDSLKHQVKPNLELVNEIRKEVGHAPWLRLKNVRKISQLPDYLEVDPNDRIGALYNLVRMEVGEFFTGQSSIKDFKGLILGASPTREMLEECSRVNSAYAAVIASISKRGEPIQKQLDLAKGELEAAFKAAEANPAPENKELLRQKRKAKSLAEEAHYTHQERTKEEIKSVISYVQLWAIGKNENRDAWCQALHRIVSNGEGTGSILVFAFPQELVNKVAERTGGKPVRVRLPRLCEGFIDVDSDGRSFLVEPIRTGPNQAGVKRTYLFTYRDRKYSAEDIPDQELAPQEATIPGQERDTVQ